MKVVHDWLKEYLGTSIPTAKEIEDLLTFHSFEIEGIEHVKTHEIIDVDVLPNRGADCLSHRGIAREIAALTGVNLEHDPFSVRPEMPETDKIKITIEDPSACRHFDLALITGVTVKESPDWLKERLEALGQRSINNVVDATNYVMFGLGQPTHVYDAAKFKQEKDVWHFGVRFGKSGQTVSTLGGDEHEVDETIQLITNEADGALAGIAGIKGGTYSELTTTTTDIIVEAGNFDPIVTRKASQKLRLQTDASKRFENGISSNVVPYAIAEVVNLILKIAGGELVGYAHARPVEMDNNTVTVSLSHVNALLGLQLTNDDVESILGRLGFLVTTSESGVWKVKAPFERTDISIAEDVIEEIGRVYGYDKVVSVVPETVSLNEFNQKHYYSEKIRDQLTDLGYSEVITSSFCKKDEIQLLNALASDKSYLRSSLLKNINEVLDKNTNFSDLLGTADTRVFEIGTVFTKGNTVEEHVSLCLGVRIRPSGYSGKEDKVLKVALEALTETLGIELEATVDKGIAEINLSDALSKLPIVTHYDSVDLKEDINYKPYSTYPSISRDIALWVTEGTVAAEVQQVIDQNAGELRVRTTLFDEFTKDGRTSYAFRLVFQAMDKTLTDEEVNEYMQAVYKAAEENNWEVR